MFVCSLITSITTLGFTDLRRRISRDNGVHSLVVRRVDNLHGSGWRHVTQRVDVVERPQVQRLVVHHRCSIWKSSVASSPNCRLAPCTQGTIRHHRDHNARHHTGNSIRHHTNTVLLVGSCELGDLSGSNGDQKLSLAVRSNSFSPSPRTVWDQQYVNRSWDQQHTVTVRLAGSGLCQMFALAADSSSGACADFFAIIGRTANLDLPYIVRQVRLLTTPEALHQLSMYKYVDSDRKDNRNGRSHQ
ncbi:hypothetical protein C0Q70_01335 [Pomacea canaliculata]|uniref:Uncharacterized protein n=1 Tax=Pomacea canaliculata TaxID=400727 RepID=A0A2T7PZ64_POMCA|nr:hypothetical protein C0Q70_01335 [Pomacea canaliculata]